MIGFTAIICTRLRIRPDSRPTKRALTIRRRKIINYLYAKIVEARQAAKSLAKK